MRCLQCDRTGPYTVLSCRKCSGAADTVRAIQAVLSGKEWQASTLDDIALILSEAGYVIATFEGGK